MAMAIAFTFPGQGSQAVGMGKDLAEAFPEARAVFDEVDEALGEKLTTTMWEGPEETLTLTANAQPALMAVSMAIIRVMEARGFSLNGKVDYVAGHSLGEYSALCAAGMFSIADTARLLRIRGKAMQQAVPVGEGAMAAIIGLEHEAVEAACVAASDKGVCQIANDNGGGQIVISGAKDAVESYGFPEKLGASYVWGADREPWGFEFDNLVAQVEFVSEQAFDRLRAVADDGPAAPNGIAVRDDTIYFTQTGNMDGTIPWRLYSITPEGEASILVEGPPLDRPNGVAFDPAQRVRDDLTILVEVTTSG
jgi:hypothetical protein